MKSANDILSRALAETAKGAANLYLGTLGFMVFRGFPILLAIGLLYFGAFIAGFLGGILGPIVFVTFPILVFTFFAIYAWHPRVDTAVREIIGSIMRALK